MQLIAPGTPEMRHGGGAEEARAGGSVPMSVNMIMLRGITCRWCGIRFNFWTQVRPPYIDEEMKRVLDEHMDEDCPKRRDAV